MSKLPADFNTTLNEKIDKGNYTIKCFSSSLTSKTTLIINSDSNLIDFEKTLLNLSSLLQINVSTRIILHESHPFLKDATWWDQSEVAEHLLNSSILSRSLNLIYSNDFYYLHNDRSFLEYLSDNRQCVNEGIFSQMQSETIPNRHSHDF